QQVAHVLANLQVRQLTALGFVVSVRNVVTHHRLFTGYFANAAHGSLPSVFALIKIVFPSRLAQRSLFVAAMLGFVNPPLYFLSHWRKRLCAYRTITVYMQC